MKNYLVLSLWHQLQNLNLSKFLRVKITLENDFFSKQQFQFYFSRYFNVEKSTYDDANHGKCRLLSHHCNINPRIEYKVLESCPGFLENQSPMKDAKEEVDEDVIEIPYWKLTRF